jgi:hypothetical protein
MRRPVYAQIKGYVRLLAFSTNENGLRGQMMPRAKPFIKGESSLMYDPLP